MGWIASYDLSYTFLAAAAVTALAFPTVLSFPKTEQYDGEVDTFTVGSALPVIRDTLLKPPLRSFVVYVSIFYAVIWTVGTYVQPVGVEVGLNETSLGWMYGGFTALSAAITYNTDVIQERLGMWTWFAVVPLGIGGLLAAAVLLPVVAMIPVFFVMRAAMHVTGPLRGQYLNNHIDSTGRATTLSAVAMVTSLVTIPFKLLAGPLGDAFSAVTAISILGAILFVGAVGTWLVEPPIKTDVSAAESPADSTAD